MGPIVGSDTDARNIYARAGEEAAVLTAMIFAKDLDTMTSFYRDGFALLVDDQASQPGFRVLVGDRIRLALHEIPDHVSSTIEIADPPEPRSSAAIKLIFGVADLAAVRGRLTALGSALFDTASDDAYDGTDPEGNLFRIHTI